MAEAQPQTTRIRPMWLGKVLVGLIVCFGFAVWSAYDAIWLYPSKQRDYIEHTELQYLGALRAEGSRAFTASNASVPDPAETRRALRDMRSEGRSPSTVESARLEWLNAIAILHSLDALASENQEAGPVDPTSGAPNKRTLTLYNNPEARWRELDTARQAVGNVSGLAAYDIPLQYLFLVVSSGLSIWLVILLVQVVPKKYRFDPETLTLTTPEGTKIVPDQIIDVDRRKWEKFLLFIRLQGESEERRFDLYRYIPLEDWLLAMEKASPHVEAPPDEPEDTPAEDSENASSADADQPERSVSG